MQNDQINPNQLLSQQTVNTTEPQTIGLNPPSLQKSRNYKKFIIIGIILLIITYIFSNLDSKNSLNDSISKKDNNNLQETKQCELMFVDPTFPSQGDVEPLFFRESASIDGQGYEAIMRRSINEDQVSMSVVTNKLPVENSPYNLVALGVDKFGTVCTQAVIGELEFMPDVGIWSSITFKQNMKITNDAVVFAITQHGYGTDKNEIIHDLDDPSIMLLGTYLQNIQ